MDISLLILAIMLLLCCAVPMLMMRKGHGESHKDCRMDHDSKSDGR